MVSSCLRDRKEAAIEIEDGSIVHGYDSMEVEAKADGS
jgi:hypothetical protein